MDLRVIGAPMDLGSDRRGVDMGPSAIRYAGLSGAVRDVGVSCDDAGDLPVPRPEGRDPNAERPDDGNAKYLKETRWVCRRVESAVADALEEGAKPLVLGGDHSIADVAVAAGAADAPDGDGVVATEDERRLAVLEGVGDGAFDPSAHPPRLLEVLGGALVGPFGVRIPTLRAGHWQVAGVVVGDPDAERPETGSANYLKETRWVCRRVESAVADALEEGAKPLVRGGDHSIAVGSVGGASRDRDVGVLWLDAHGDFNTPETTPSGNVHGMPLAAVLGHGAFGEMSWATAPIDEENVSMVGLRDVDDAERTAILDSEVDAYTMSDVDTRGIVPVVEDALESALDGVDALHVSLDMDFLDPDEAPGVGTPVTGGATYREAHAAMELVAETDALCSLEVVEVNPILDSHNRTADLAVELVSSALGGRIL